MHEIAIVHMRREKIDRIESDDGAVTIVEKCRDCGKETSILDLSQVRGPSLNNLPHKKRLDELKKVRETYKRFNALSDEMNRGLLDGTGYSEISDLLGDLKKRYQHQIRVDDMSYHQLGQWVDTRTKKIRRKVLLGYKQGPVCNRCDSLLLSLAQLTEDHILPRACGGQSTLLNLQLLCRRCNQDKDDSGPSEKDISPFAFEGPSCVHKITCVAVEKLRQS